MSNRPQCIPPTKSTRPACDAAQDLPDRRPPGATPIPQTAEAKLSPDQIAFRQTFLWRFHRPEVAAAFRLAGDAVIALMNEAGEWGPDRDLPWTVGEVRAASEDLEHLARYLEVVAEDRRGATLDEASDALSIHASGWAERLDALVLDMRRSLAQAWDGELEPEMDPDSDRAGHSGPVPVDDRGCN